MKQPKRWLLRIGLVGLALLILTILAMALMPYEAQAETITAYSSVETCPNRPCIMASGKKAYIGAVACPRKLKLGTQIKIDGKTYTCEDRTSKKYDGRYDIFMGYGKEAYTRAIKFGKRTLTIN